MCKIILITVISLIVSLTAFTQAATYGGGNGTQVDPYQIWTPEQMNIIGVNPLDWGKQFKLMADVDMSAYMGTQYNIIGNSLENHPFTGTFEGNGHVIRNLTYLTSGTLYAVGLFGYTSGATIRNLGIENVSLSSSDSDIGGLVGQNDGGFIITCHATGVINGGTHVGGLVGFNLGSITTCYASCTVNGSISAGGLVGENSGTLTSCYATGSVNDGWWDIGGLVGWNTGTITNCYATGSVIGDFEIGGLVGGNWLGDIITCYATGLVSGTGSYVGGLIGENCEVEENYYGLVTACFWDIQTSNLTSSDGGTGKTTTEMKTQSTFINAGWDFSETDGDLADWWMPSNEYPRLMWGRYGGGSGTAENPYQIWRPEEMNAIGVNSGDWGSHFKLMDDIDMSIYTGTQYNIIGNSTTQFTGVFDGNRHVIRNLNYATSEVIDYIGLFGYTTNATIKYLGIEDVLISSDGNTIKKIGGLVGYNDSSIISCYVTGLINGEASRYSSVGGLVGENDGLITACYATGSIIGGQRVGGLVGENYYGTVNNCYTNSLVSGGTTEFSNVGGLVGENDGIISACYTTGSNDGSSNVGGLVGINNNSMITSCYATGSVNGTGTFSNAGGLVGENNGSITSCYATGVVIGKGFFTGGLVGDNSDGSAITTCYATGPVSADRMLGGLAGNNAGSITSCYSTSLITGSGLSVGGLVGNNTWGWLTTCFWDTQTSNITKGIGSGSSSGVTGKTTAQMQTLSTFTLAGWDFTTIWAICEETNYPRLQWQILPADFACPDGVNLEDLNYYVGHWLMNNCTSTNNYCGGADLNYSGVLDLADWAIFAENWMSQ